MVFYWKSKLRVARWSSFLVIRQWTVFNSRLYEGGWIWTFGQCMATKDIVDLGGRVSCCTGLSVCHPQFPQSWCYVAPWWSKSCCRLWNGCQAECWPLQSTFRVFLHISYPKLCQRAYCPQSSASNRRTLFLSPTLIRVFFPVCRPTFYLQITVHIAYYPNRQTYR